MDFWEDLSPAVKRYVVLGAALLLLVISLRTCVGPETSANPPPRGAVNQ